MVVNIFVGSPENCDKLSYAYEAFRHLQHQHPGIIVETFVVPVPDDPASAVVMKKALIHNINRTFEVAYPKKEDMN